MTDDEWLICLDPDLLLDAAKAAKRLNARKSRLFGCGCFRLVWDQITTRDVRVAVEKSEQRADRLISDQELERYRYPLGHPDKVVDHWLCLSVQSLAMPNSNPSYVAWSVRSSTENDIYRHARRGLPCRSQADLVREVVGNPYRAVTFESRWRTSDVLGLARAIYEDRAFDRMPILADALMDAGCADEQVLTHCREPGPHIRGCWVVDLVLNKK
jgi:hypothetical protein